MFYCVLEVLKYLYIGTGMAVNGLLETTWQINNYSKQGMREEEQQILVVVHFTQRTSMRTRTGSERSGLRVFLVKQYIIVTDIPNDVPVLLGLLIKWDSNRNDAGTGLGELRVGRDLRSSRSCSGK